MCAWCDHLTTNVRDGCSLRRRHHRHNDPHHSTECSPGSLLAVKRPRERPYLPVFIHSSMRSFRFSRMRGSSVLIVVWDGYTPALLHPPPFLYVDENEWAHTVAVSVASTSLQACSAARGTQCLVKFLGTLLNGVPVSEGVSSCRGYREKQSLPAETHPYGQSASRRARVLPARWHASDHRSL